MKRVLCIAVIIFLTSLCFAAMAKPPLPETPYLKNKLSLGDSLVAKDSYLKWLMRKKLAPNEYFALAFLENPASAQMATIVANYSEDGLNWNKPVIIPIKKTSAMAVQGVDLTNHNWGILQGFAYDYKSMELDRLFGFKSANGLQMNPPQPGFPVPKATPPATVILPNGDQLLACNIGGTMTLLKGNIDTVTGFTSIKLKCDKNITGRPDLTLKKNKLLIAWHVPGKGITTALYEVSPLGKLIFIRCKLALISGATQPGEDYVYEIKSAPALADCDETFYIGVASKRQDEPAAKFRIYRSADAVDWKLEHTLGGLLHAKIKLGLAAKIDGGLFAALLEKTKSGVRYNAWLYHTDSKHNWLWTDLQDAPWAKIKPGFNEFGLDSGGVRR